MHPGIRKKAKGRTGERAAGLRVPSKPGVRQQDRGKRISVVQRQVFDGYPVTAPIRRQNIPFRGAHIRWLVEFRPEKAARQRVLAVRPVHLAEPLVVVLNNGRPGKRQHVPGTAGERYVVEEEHGRPTERGGRNLIVEEWSFSAGIDDLFADDIGVR